MWREEKKGEGKKRGKVEKVEEEGKEFDPSP